MASSIIEVSQYSDFLPIDFMILMYFIIKLPCFLSTFMKKKTHTMNLLSYLWAFVSPVPGDHRLSCSTYK